MAMPRSAVDRHPVACLLQATHLGDLAVGEDAGHDAADPHLGGDGVSGAGVVPGDQYHVEPEGTQRLDRLTGSGP
jgi:hypothetical protein